MSDSQTTTSQVSATKVDLKKQYKELYNPPASEAVFVQIPDMQFLMLDGAGDPNTAPAYKDAIEALYSVSYGLKFLLKKEQAIDYTVMPLEGLWWTENMHEFSVNSKDLWLWTMMIMQPEEVTEALFERVREQVKRKKTIPGLEKMRLERFHEGLATQIMHLGPFSEEGPTVERLHAFIQRQGYTLEDTKQKHHEIYLSDPRKAAPGRMKTVIRQPVASLPT